MRYLTVKRNKNGEPNKTDMKSLAKFLILGIKLLYPQKTSIRV